MALATTDDLKALLSIRHAEDDALLLRLVGAASEWFEKQAGRTFLSTEYVEVQDGNGATAIAPRMYPVVSVSHVFVAGVELTESTAYGVDGWYQHGDLIRIRGGVFTAGEGNVEITYQAGYAAVPNDVNQAVLEVAGLMYRERDRYGQQSKTMGGESVAFYYTPPSRVMATIEAYRRVD